MIFPPPIYSIFTNLNQHLAKMDQNVPKNMENARFSLFTTSEGKCDIAFNIANDDTNIDNIAGNSADNSDDNSTVLPSITFFKKAGDSIPNSEIRLNPERASILPTRPGLSPQKYETPCGCSLREAVSYPGPPGPGPVRA